MAQRILDGMENLHWSFAPNRQVRGLAHAECPAESGREFDGGERSEGAAGERVELWHKSTFWQRLHPLSPTLSREGRGC